MSTLQSFRSNRPERVCARAARLTLLDAQATRDDVRRVLREDFARPPVSGPTPPRARLDTDLLVYLAIVVIAIGTLFIAQAAYIRAKAEFAQVLLESAWQQTQTTGRPTKAWAWADTWPVARLTFPGLNRSAIVLNEGGGEALAFGPAHVAASAKPGAAGTTIIAAHRDTHFSFIKNLRPGDEIDLTTPQRTTIRYRMTGASIVHAKASGIATAGKSRRLALVTCYPFDGLQHGALRYVVFAEEPSPKGT